MTDTATTETSSPFGDIVFEDIPAAAPRPPGKGREPVKWEEHLAPLQEKLLETPARLWSYQNKTGAVSRMSAVRTRLTDAAPALHWEFKVRPVPNTEPQLHGVYAVFHGQHSPEQQLKNAQARQERRERVQKANEARIAANATQGVPEATTDAPPAMTAKEKLAQKAQAK